MEPFTIILIILFTLFGGNVARVTHKRVKRSRREALREALLQKFPAPDRYVSIFDIFWDLGVSDYALVIMGHQDLLPRHPDELPAVFARIDERIKEHGSYAAFIHDVLEAIQEFYQDHKMAGDRRALPTLELPSVKLLPLPEAHQVGAPPTSTAPRSQIDDDIKALEDELLPDGYLLDVHLDERARIRESRSATDSALVPSRGQRGVDLDELLKAGPLDIIKGLLDGGMLKRFNTWTKLRELRELRAALDTQLIALYRYFDQLARHDPDFFAPLYDLTRRWEREALRIERLEAARPWRERPFAPAGDLLMEEARILARYLSRHARKNTDDAIRAIREKATRGDEAMAGYLVYANRYAFFAGRGDGHAALVSQIEYAASRVQTELRELRQKQLI